MKNLEYIYIYVTFSNIFNIMAGCVIKVGYMEIINNSRLLF